MKATFLLNPKDEKIKWNARQQKVRCQLASYVFINLGQIAAGTPVASGDTAGRVDDMAGSLRRASAN
jgi:hypothetical protein